MPNFRKMADEPNLIIWSTRMGCCFVVVLWIVIISLSFSIGTKMCCPDISSCDCIHATANGTGTGVVTLALQADCNTCQSNKKVTEVLDDYKKHVDEGKADESDYEKSWDAKDGKGCKVLKDDYEYCGNNSYHQPTATMCYIVVGILLTLGLLYASVQTQRSGAA